jgi:hypothetical protein
MWEALMNEWRVKREERVRTKEALATRREEAARHELHDLKIRIARLEAVLSRAENTPR